MVVAVFSVNLFKNADQQLDGDGAHTFNPRTQEKEAGGSLR